MAGRLQEQVGNMLVHAGNTGYAGLFKAENVHVNIGTG